MSSRESKRRHRDHSHSSCKSSSPCLRRTRRESRSRSLSHARGSSRQRSSHRKETDPSRTKEHTSCSSQTCKPKYSNQPHSRVSHSSRSSSSSGSSCSRSGRSSRRRSHTHRYKRTAGDQRSSKLSSRDRIHSSRSSVSDSRRSNVRQSNRRSRSNSPCQRSVDRHREQRSHSRSLDPQYNRCTELNYLLHDACYFLMKSNNFDNLLLAQAESVWSTPPHNEARINNAFMTKSNVILIFAAKESSSFQGFARVSAESNKNYPPLPWVLPVGLSAKSLSSVFTLDWISRNPLPYSRIRHLRNAVNADRPVNVGRDGQEIDAAAGEAVCRLFDIDWLKADAQRAVQKSQVTLELRGFSVAEIGKTTSRSK